MDIVNMKWILILSNADFSDVDVNIVQWIEDI